VSVLTAAILRQLAAQRAAEALSLMRDGHHGGAYYLAGYAVEMALKARIAMQFRAGEIPDKAQVNAVYTHRLADLMKQAGLSHSTAGGALENELDSNQTFAANWGIVSQWNEQSRYQLIGVVRAQELVSAVTEPKDGVYPWLTRHW